MALVSLLGRVSFPQSVVEGGKKRESSWHVILYSGREKMTSELRAS